MSLPEAMAMLMAVFDKYASNEGRKDTLTKYELLKLLETEMPCANQSKGKSDGLDALMNSLDRDKDSEVNFQEFVTFICALTCACHKSK